MRHSVSTSAWWSWCTTCRGKNSRRHAALPAAPNEAESRRGARCPDRVGIVLARTRARIDLPRPGITSGEWRLRGSRRREAQGLVARLRLRARIADPSPQPRRQDHRRRADSARSRPQTLGGLVQRVAQRLLALTLGMFSSTSSWAGRCGVLLPMTGVELNPHQASRGKARQLDRPLIGALATKGHLVVALEPLVLRADTGRKATWQTGIWGLTLAPGHSSFHLSPRRSPRCRTVFEARRGMTRLEFFCLQAKRSCQPLPHPRSSH